MKTFDLKNLITWSNRDQAVIGKPYYFGDNKAQLNDRIRASECNKLHNIESCDIKTPFVDDYDDCYACILPVDAVKETEPEKKYRACKNIRDFYRVVMLNGQPTLNVRTDENYIYDLIDIIIHIKNKKTEKEYFSMITSITKDADGTYKFLVHGACYSLSALFNNFEIKINGEWRPFGVEDDTNI